MKNILKKLRSLSLRSAKLEEPSMEGPVTGTFRVENLKAQIFKDLHKHVEIVSQTFATGEGSNDKDDKERDSSSDDELHVEDWTWNFHKNNWEDKKI